MFSHIFGRFLIEQNLLSDEKFKEVTEFEKTSRVKLGLIAVAERLLTREQAEKVNGRQMIEDRRFGDIAVELGYLTDGQVDRLLKLQGNPYLVFVQAVTEKEYMSMEEIEDAMDLFQKTYGYTSTDMEDLRSGDVDRIVPLFVRSKNKYAKELAGVAIRTVTRLIDSRIGIGVSYETDRFEFENMAVQNVEGEHDIMFGFAGEGANLLTIANIFGQEDFEEMDPYSFDAICEFINCINGLYASQLSTEGVEVDMIPPTYFRDGYIKADGKILIVPIYINNSKIRIVIAVDAHVSISE